MIQFQNVTKRYSNGHEALSDLSFEINRGEMAFITGHSGAGKSTILKLLALMERPTKGQILINQFNINEISESKVPFLRRAMGFIFQQPRLLLDRNVFENVALPLLITSHDHHEIGRRVRAALDKVGLLTKERYLPDMLSTGEQQRVGIERAIVTKPALLLADEPTGNLDPALANEIMKLFQQFNQVGVALLIASHDLNLIHRFQKRMITLQEGKLIADTKA